MQKHKTVVCASLESNQALFGETRHRVDKPQRLLGYTARVVITSDHSDSIGPIQVRVDRFMPGREFGRRPGVNDIVQVRGMTGARTGDTHGANLLSSLHTFVYLDPPLCQMKVHGLYVMPAIITAMVNSHHVSPQPGVLRLYYYARRRSQDRISDRATDVYALVNP